MTNLVFADEHEVTSGQDISSMAFWRKPFLERDETFACHVADDSDDSDDTVLEAVRSCPAMALSLQAL
jgi:hypothetical protein